MMQLTTRLEPVLDVSEVAALEQRLDASGTSLAELMDRAGSALAVRIEQQMPAPARVVVLAGSGNNGGDGWVAARLLADAGYAVALVAKRPASDIRAHPAHEAALAAARAGIDVRVSPGAGELAELLAQADAVIDAILGTGFTGDTVREPYGASDSRPPTKPTARGGSSRLQPTCRAGFLRKTARRRRPRLPQTAPSPCSRQSRDCSRPARTRSRERSCSPRSSNAQL